MLPSNCVKPRQKCWHVATPSSKLMWNWYFAVQQCHFRWHQHQIYVKRMECRILHPQSLAMAIIIVCRTDSCTLGLHARARTRTRTTCSRFKCHSISCLQLSFSFYSILSAVCVSVTRCALRTVIAFTYSKHLLSFESSSNWLERSTVDDKDRR